MNQKVKRALASIGIFFILAPVTLLLTDSRNIVEVMLPLISDSAENLRSTHPDNIDTSREIDLKTGKDVVTLTTKPRRASVDQLKRYKNLSGAIRVENRNAILSLTSVPIGLILLVSVLALRKSRSTVSLLIVISIAFLGTSNFGYHYFDIGDYLRQKQFEPYYEQRRQVFERVSQHISSCREISESMSTESCTVLLNIKKYYSGKPLDCWGDVFADIDDAGFSLPPHDLIVPAHDDCDHWRKLAPLDWSTMESK